MPYFIYRISGRESDKTLQRLASYDTFPDAKDHARKIRAMPDTPPDVLIKIIFADDAEEAEGLLRQKREPPILREWEK